MAKFEHLCVPCVCPLKKLSYGTRNVYLFLQVLKGGDTEDNGTTV